MFCFMKSMGFQQLVFLVFFSASEISKNEREPRATKKKRESRRENFNQQTDTSSPLKNNNNKTQTATEEERERDDIQLGRFDGVLPVRVLVPGAFFFRQGFFFLSFLATLFFF